MNSRFYGFNHNRNDAMKIEQILIYEQDNYYAFYPFCILHPSWELRVGALRIFEKYQKLFAELQDNFQNDTNEMLKFMGEIKDMMNLPEDQLVHAIRTRKFDNNKR